ncbi:MAG TPA: ADP-ribosylation factor-like protein, partial [Thermoanaerobaculia bacterium]
MAVLDVEQNAVVIRIVYDGPPEAGKTTSLRALSASLARPMSTPAEAGDRTLFFDWLEYTGGLFEGHRIRCQVITVPGQTVLAHRRHTLLETADAVVFVSDSNATAVETTRAYMTEMRAVLDASPGPRIGVIVQANKRDHDDAVDMATLRAAMPEDGIAVIESVATEGRGVRETFVFAVRLALDRVRELLRTRELEHRSPDVQTSDDLLRQMTRSESHRAVGASQLESAAQSALQEVVDAEVAEPRAIAQTGAAPLAPDHNVPSGMIWPPVEGRVRLLDACSTPFTPRETSHGDWIGETDGWRFHSPRRATYADPELGRRALIEWSRLHASGQRWFSSPRVVVLAATGDGAWRLWQIVKVERSLRDDLVDGVADSSPQGLLRRLLDAGRLLFAATESLALAPCRLPISVDTVGASNGLPLYVGLLPDPFLVRSARPIPHDHRTTLLRRELSALAATELRRFDGASFPTLRTIQRDGDSAAV